MANRPANAGSGRGLAPTGNAAPPLGAVVPPQWDTPPPPPPVHHDPPRATPPRSRAPTPPQGGNASGLAWMPYLIVLAGVAAGMFVAWQGSKYAGRGAGLVGCSLLAAGLARLILPPRYAGLLSTRRKASDVLAFTVFGGAVLAVALMLP